MCLRSLTEDQILGEIIELSTLCQLDTKLRVDGAAVLAMDVLGPDVADLGEPVLGEQLGDLGDQGDAFSHSFDLDSAMLLEDELAQEQPLVEPRVAADSEDVGLVELGVFFIHCSSTSLTI